MILIADSGATKTDWCLTPESATQRGESPLTMEGARMDSRDKERTGPRNEELTGPRNEERTGPRNEERTGPRDEERTGPRNEELTGPRNEARTGPRDEVRFSTQGITPVHQSEETIRDILRGELLPRLAAAEVTAVHFYGAGCTPQKIPAMSRLLTELLPSAQTVEVAGDMLGAARALCGKQAGIVCILGTGSNSCYYDGESIVSNVSPLGYILGDEGSGAYLGKRLVGDCLKGQLPERLCRRFLERFQLTPADIIERVYRQPLANRFLASLSCFLGENRQEPEIHKLLVECFSAFVRRNLLSYPAAKLYCTGSIAYYYAEELHEAAAAFGLQIERILQKPMEGLVAYHTRVQNEQTI